MNATFSALAEPNRLQIVELLRHRPLPVGRIERGMPADLVLVHGDPLSDARALWRIWAVFQAGARVA